MLKRKSIPAFFLAAVLLSLPLASCANTGTKPDTTTTQSQQDTTVQQTTESDKVLPDLPDTDLEGYEFNFLVRSANDTVWQSRDIVAAEETGEAINDAVYARNKYVEDKYNFKITATDYDGNITGLKSSLTAGDSTYDALMIHGRDQATLAMAGLLADIYTIPNLDLDKPWWNKATEEQLSIGGKLFFTDGDISITSKNGMRVIFFNKKMIQDYSLDNPYELVKNNQWTLDKLYSMCKDVSYDENGDGAFDENDRYGFLVQSGISINMFYGAGEKLAVKDAEDIPHLNVGSARSLEILDLLTNILSSKNAVMFDSDYADKGMEHMLQATFEDNRGLFFAEVLQLAERMRSADQDFGILPVPKYEAAQEDYYSYVDFWCMAPLSVPVTNAELDKTGIILESMAAEAKYTLTPAYYNLALQGKYIRDNESSEMLDIIFKNKVVSIDEIYNWGMHDAIQGVLKARTGTFASTIEKNTAAVEKKINSTVTTFEGIAS
ncbi:MAG: hypothetical protein AB9835_06405 [Eubacteriales bacterium]